MSSPLLELAKLITDAATFIERRYQEEKLQFPDLNSTEQVTPAQRDLAQEKSVAHATSVAIAAASQLIATIRDPGEVVLDIANKHSISACLSVASTFHMTEIIKEEGSNGSTTEDIAIKTGIDPQNCGRVLRALATHHIFREVSPNRFANNRASMVLYTGKNVRLLNERPAEKFASDSLGIAALVEHQADELFKSTSYLTEAFQLTVKEKKYHLPLSVAYKTPNDFFGWQEQPENALKFVRFSAAMRDLTDFALDAVTQGFDWGSLKENSKVVDVGGRVGHMGLEIFKDHPHLHIVVQDRPSVMEEALEWWKTYKPEAVENGRVSFQGIDFFKEQPTKDAAVFLLRHVIHDWSDDNSRIILQHLRAAAQPTTRLVVADRVIPFACPVPKDSSQATAHAKADSIQDIGEEKAPPYPLLGNYGLAGGLSIMLDLAMMAILNGQERTRPHVVELLRSAGWEVESIYTSSRNSVAKAVVARLI